MSGTTPTPYMLTVTYVVPGDSMIVADTKYTGQPPGEGIPTPQGLAKQAGTPPYWTDPVPTNGMINLGQIVFNLMPNEKFSASDEAGLRKRMAHVALYRAFWEATFAAKMGEIVTHGPPTVAREE